MSLRALRDRLTAIIEENERRGWSERNDLPTVIAIEQPKTPTGRLRPDQHHPIHRAESCMFGLPTDEGRVQVVRLISRRSPS
jgi:hypothetical protein